MNERKKATDFDATQKLISKYEQFTTKPPSPSTSPVKPKAETPVQPTPQPAGQPSPANGGANSNNNLRQRPQAHSSQTPQQQQPQQPQKPTAPPTRGLFEKLVDYMVGVNSQNGFALICSNCRAHNGLAPSSELESIQFRCRFCGLFNDASVAPGPGGGVRPRSASSAQLLPPQSPPQGPQQQLEPHPEQTNK